MEERKGYSYTLLRQTCQEVKEEETRSQSENLLLLNSPCKSHFIGVMNLVGRIIKETVGGILKQYRQLSKTG